MTKIMEYEGEHIDTKVELDNSRNISFPLVKRSRVDMSSTSETVLPESWGK